MASATATETAAPVREHMKMVEVETEEGYRFWTAPMPETEAEAYLDMVEAGPNYISDYDCSSSCWCVEQ